jgi:hypothetical protein
VLREAYFAQDRYFDMVRMSHLEGDRRVDGK